VTLFPVLAALLYIWYKGAALDWIGVGGLLLGVTFGHLGANLLNDYADWDESDRLNKKAGPFNGGSRFLLGTHMKRTDFLMLALFFFSITIILWIYFFMNRGISVFWIGLAGILCGVLYSQKPFQFQKRGLGEILVFLAFGPVLTLGTGALFDKINLNVFLLGLPFGLVTLNIIFLNEIPDLEADLESGKRNWAVRMGENAALALVPWLHLSIYVSLILLFAFGFIPHILLAMILPLFFSFLFLGALKKGIPAAQKALILFQIIFGFSMSFGFIIMGLSR
jgi:1,4-dihydroxy-2-naphthoate octaprenyltransferase